MRKGNGLVSSTIVLLPILMLTSTSACPDKCTCTSISARCENFTQTTHKNLLNNTRSIIIVNLKNSLLPCSVTKAKVTSVTIQESNLNNKPLGWSFHCYPSILSFTLNNNNLPVLRNTTFTTSERPKSVRFLTISNSNLSTIQSGAFSFFDKLTTLNILNNPLEITQDSLFSGLRELAYLQIHFVFRSVNRVPENIFKQSPKLRSLIIYIKNLDTLSRVKIPFHLPQLKSLTVSGNIRGIENDTFCGLSSLSTLTLQKHEINDLPVDFMNCLPSLSMINLAHNKIRRLLVNPRHRLTPGTKLIKIGLSYNKIGSFPSALSHLYPNVKSLDLGVNPLTLWTGDLSLPRYQCNFEHLSFYRCGIQSIPTDYLKNCAYLKTLNFAYNKLLFVPNMLPPNQKLLLNLNSNPLYCGCRHNGLALLIINEPTTTSATFFQCSSPPNMTGKGIPRADATIWRSFRTTYSTLPKCKAPVIQHFNVTDQELSLIECQVSGDPPPTIIMIEPNGKKHTYLPNIAQEQHPRRLVASAPGIYSCSANNGQGEVIKGLRFPEGDSIDMTTVYMEPTRGMMFVTEATPGSDGNNVLLSVLPPVAVGIVLVFVIAAATFWIRKRFHHRLNSSFRAQDTSEERRENNHDTESTVCGTSTPDHVYDHLQFENNA